MTTETEKTDNEFTLRLVKGWHSFKEKVAAAAENWEEAAVQLHFESSLDERTHHAFEPDEPVFISDITITPKNQVAFGVPFKDSNKYFLNNEAELIDVKADGTSQPFNQIVTQLFREAMVDVPECPSITILERKHLLADGMLRDALNDSETYINRFALTKERAVLYNKLDDYGMF